METTVTTMHEHPIIGALWGALFALITLPTLSSILGAFIVGAAGAAGGLLLHLIWNKIKKAIRKNKQQLHD